MKLKVWGARGSVPAPGPENESLRREHVVRRARALGRLHPDHRRRHGHPQPRGRNRQAAAQRSTSSSPLHLDHIQGLMFSHPASGRSPRSRSGARRRPRLRSRSGSRATSRPPSPLSRSASFPCGSTSGTPAQRWRSAGQGVATQGARGPRQGRGGPRCSARFRSSSEASGDDGPQIVILDSDRKQGAKNIRPCMWSRCRWVRRC